MAPSISRPSACHLRRVAGYEGWNCDFARCNGSTSDYDRPRHEIIPPGKPTFNKRFLTALAAATAKPEGVEG